MAAWWSEGRLWVSVLEAVKVLLLWLLVLLLLVLFLVWRELQVWVAQSVGVGATHPVTVAVSLVQHASTIRMTIAEGVRRARGVLVRWVLNVVVLRNRRMLLLLLMWLRWLWLLLILLQWPRNVLLLLLWVVRSLWR